MNSRSTLKKALNILYWMGIDDALRYLVLIEEIAPIDAEEIVYNLIDEL